MRKFLSVFLSILILLTTVSGVVCGLSVAAEDTSTAIDLIDAELWSKNPASQYMSINEGEEDDFSIIKVSITQYNAYNVTLDLKTDTDYLLCFDVKSSLKFENLQIWPTKCAAMPSSDGSIVWDTESYTVADRILFKGGYDATNNLSNELGFTSPNTWYENNVVEFKTNGTDTSYQIFFKMNGFINKEENSTDVVFFKNSWVKEKVQAEALACGNGTATVSKEICGYGDTVTFTATSFKGEVFKGWYSEDKLISTESSFSKTMDSANVSLTAKFSTYDLMNLDLWKGSPNRPTITITAVTDNNEEIIKLNGIDWNFFYINMELEPSTTYKFSYDVKTALKLEDLQIWPTKCGGTTKSDGNITYDTENYTTADRILQVTSFPLVNANQTWFENNSFEFTTNSSDSSYQLFLKFAGYIDKSSDSVPAVYFKNVSVKEIVTAAVSTFGNGVATVSKIDGYFGDEVTYTAVPDTLERFLGWYKDFNLVSSDAEYNTTLSSGSNLLTAHFTTKNNSNLNSWHTNPMKASMAVSKTVENEQEVISVKNIRYSLYWIDAELKPSTEYVLRFDFKSPIMLENLQVWPTKCSPGAASDGSVGYDKENYTTNDRILFIGGYNSSDNLSVDLGHTNADIWYEDNTVTFTTNSTDTFYQIFFKMNTFVDSTVNSSDEIYFKNLSVEDPFAKTEDFLIVSEDMDGSTIADVKDITPIETTAIDNGDGTITAKVSYDHPSETVIFKGWYEGATFISNSEEFIFDSNEINASKLVAKFVNRNILIGAGSFENFATGTSLRVSPAGEGVLPENEKWGMWSNWPTNTELSSGYECDSGNYSVDILSGEQENISYLSELELNKETGELTYATGVTSVSPRSGNKMLRIKAPYRSMVRKIDNLRPSSNYTLSFYVWNPDRWTCLRNAVICDSVDMKTYLLENDTSKTYAYYKGMSATTFVADTGLDEGIPVREWQKITLKFSTDADTDHLYLHLAFARSSKGSTTGNVYFDDLICTEDIFAVKGNAIRADDAALRFKFSVPNKFLQKYYEGADLSKLGLLVSYTDELSGELDLSNALKNSEVFENNYQYEEDDERNTYITAALYNIGRNDGGIDYSFYAKAFSVRPYVIYQKQDGTELTFYGDTLSADIFDVMREIKHQSISDEDMAIVDKLLENRQIYNAFIALQSTDGFYVGESTVTDYAYSMAAIGDIQITSYYFPDKLHYIYDWIIENKDVKNIKHVFGLGDITDENTAAEWQVAEEQFKRLQKAGIEQSLVRGNHDWYYNNNITLEEYGEGLVSYDGTMSNTYRLTTISGIKYMMLCLDLYPGDDVVEWAEEVIKEHSDYNVILTTHAYFKTGMANGSGELLQDSDIYYVDDAQTANSGQDIYDKLVLKYSNIVLVMCGHNITYNHGPAYRITTRDDGSEVVEMMVNHQRLESNNNRSYGMLAMLYFLNDGETVSLEFFSTVNGMYYMDECQYEFKLDLIK